MNEMIENIDELMKNVEDGCIISMFKVGIYYLMFSENIEIYTDETIKYNTIDNANAIDDYEVYIIDIWNEYEKYKKHDKNPIKYFLMVYLEWLKDNDKYKFECEYVELAIEKIGEIFIDVKIYNNIIAYNNIGYHINMNIKFLFRNGYITLYKLSDIVSAFNIFQSMKNIRNYKECSENKIYFDMVDYHIGNIYLTKYFNSVTGCNYITILNEICEYNWLNRFETKVSFEFEFKNITNTSSYTSLYYEKAIMCYQQNMENIENLEKLMLMYKWIEKYEKVIECGEKMINLLDKYFENSIYESNCIYEMSYSYIKMEKYDDAYECIKTLIKHGNTQVIMDIALMFEKNKRYIEAKKIYELLYIKKIENIKTQIQVVKYSSFFENNHDIYIRVIKNWNDVIKFIDDDHEFEWTKESEIRIILEKCMTKIKSKIFKYVMTKNLNEKIIVEMMENNNNAKEIIYIKEYESALEKKNFGYCCICITDNLPQIMMCEFSDLHTSCVNCLCKIDKCAIYRRDILEKFRDENEIDDDN
jgi:hypothetical protein